MNHLTCTKFATYYLSIAVPAFVYGVKKEILFLLNDLQSV